MSQRLWWDGIEWPPNDDWLIQGPALHVDPLCNPQTVSCMQKLAARRRVVAIRNAINQEQAKLLLLDVASLALHDVLQLARLFVPGDHAVAVPRSLCLRRVVDIFVRAHILAERRTAATMWVQRLATGCLVCLHIRRI